MKTIQEELGGVLKRKKWRMLAKSKPRMGRKRKKISKIVKMRRMNPQAPDFGFKEIICLLVTLE
jgi:hypothetical protein